MSLATQKKHNPIRIRSSLANGGGKHVATVCSGACNADRYQTGIIEKGWILKKVEVTDSRENCKFRIQ